MNFGGLMRKLVMGLAVMMLIVISAKTEAKPSGALSSTIEFDLFESQILGEVGIASWYGEAFDGNPTASGEIYDMNGLTAAHKELPLGTILKVTNLRNNRSIVVRVNDRGPYVAGRFLDLSKAGAYRLGFMGSGLALVQAQVLRYPKKYEEARAGRGTWGE